MPDFLSKTARSARMSLIRAKNTKIELKVFSVLRRLRVRFSRHARRLPGCPDVVISDAKAIVFIDGDFWHGRRFESWRDGLAPYWATKIERNMARDRASRRLLRTLGWKVFRLWGNDVARRPERCVLRVLRAAGVAVDQDREERLLVR